MTELLYRLIKKKFRSLTMHSLLWVSVCPLFVALVMECPQTVELVLFYMGRETRRWIKNSHETLFQGSFLWKNCPHWSNNRIPKGKSSIRSTRNWDLFRVFFRVCRHGWKISIGWRAESHSHSFWGFPYSGQSPIVWFC